MRSTTMLASVIFFSFAAVFQRSPGSTMLAGADASSFLGSQEPIFRAPQLTPKQFLIISSPVEAKIVYTELSNFKSKHGRTFVLIDSGLGEPCGLSLDHERGNLYVADRQARKIFRYGLRVKKELDGDGNEVLSLTTDANRLTILSGRSVEWVTVAYTGDVLYSDQGSKSINRITAAVMDKISAGEIEADDLQVISEKQAEATAAVNAANALNGDEETPPDPSLGSIMSIYEGSLNPRVSTPAGVASDGIRLYWTNAEDGKTSGSVVLGEVEPKPPPMLAASGEPQPFPATALAFNTNASYGVAKSATMVFYATVKDDSGAVFGVDAQTNDGNVYAFAQGLTEPRGLVWDGDNTVFVADKGASAVYSFPVGRLVESSPLTKAVDFASPFGVAVLTEGDTAWDLLPSAATKSAASLMCLALALFLL